MDRKEAKEILLESIKKYRRKSYSELLKYLDWKNIECFSVKGKSGKNYEVELNVFWDDKPGENLRVILDAHEQDLWWFQFFNPSVDFIISPDGSFVGE